MKRRSMHKYIRNGLVIASVVAVAVFLGFKIKLQQEASVDSKGIEKIVIFEVGTPSTRKVIDDEKDIKRIVRTLNVLNKKRKVWEDRGTVRGAHLTISFYNDMGVWVESVSFLSHYVAVDDSWYQISERGLKKIETLYEELDYPKEEVE